MIDYDETVGNCAVRLDPDNNQAVKQISKRAFVDGKVVSQTACQDTDPAITYQIYKSYSDCTPRVDNANNKVIPRYKTFYLQDNANKTILNNSCVDDTETRYDIVEDFGSCGVTVDYDNNVVRRKSNTYYYDIDANRHDLTSCAVSTSAATLPLTKDIEPCSIRDDFNQNKSFQQEALTYIFQGQKYVARGCQDSATSYSHVQYKFNESGNLLCPVGKSPLGDAVVVFYRTGYIKSNARKYITQCVASETESAILTTMDGCVDMNLWVHDFSAGFSRSRTRTYFLIDGARKYLTNCADGTQTFNHNYELMAYQFNDAALNNYPLYRVYINVDGVRYDIKNNHLMTGAIAQPYQLQSTAIIDAPANTHTYQGCTKIVPQMNQGTYQRGDGSLYVAPGITNGTNRTFDDCQLYQIPMTAPFGTATHDASSGVVTYTITSAWSNGTNYSGWNCACACPKWCGLCSRCGVKKGNFSFSKNGVLTNITFDFGSYQSNVNDVTGLSWSSNTYNYNLGTAHIRGDGFILYDF